VLRNFQTVSEEAVSKVHVYGLRRSSPKQSSSKSWILDPGLVACYALRNVSTNVGVCSVSQDRCDLICIDAPRAETIRARLLGEGEVLKAAELAKALSDPTRLTLVEALSGGDELCVCDLSWIVGRSQNLVSHHLGALRSRGLVRSRKDGKMVMYSLTEAGVSLLSAVVGDTKAARVGA
jgi:DNA-binding transcriptional ArsR family regulator